MHHLENPHSSGRVHGGGVSHFGVFWTSAPSWCFMVDLAKKWSFYLSVSFSVSLGRVDFSKIAFCSTVFSDLYFYKVSYLFTDVDETFYFGKMTFLCYFFRRIPRLGL